MAEPTSARQSRWPAAACLLVTLCGAGAVHAQTNNGPAIYSCIDASGRKLTRDRPIFECNAIGQRVLNPDGSLRQLIPPTMTAEEAGAVDERNREAETERIHQRDAIKRDQNLLNRFPNEAAHRKAREVALADLRKSVRNSELRLAALAKERKPLLDDSEFYAGKPLPLKLKLALDANDASVEAQRSLMQNQQLEIVRIDKLYDDELERLRRLWAGARPGSLGPLAAASAPLGAAPSR